MKSEQAAPGPIRYHAVRLFLRATATLYVRASVEGAGRLPPAGPYIICFNHPSWLDPILLAARWPDRRRRLFIFGPREQDMGRGVRNRIIIWTRRGVPFKPRSQDVLDATRRAVAVLKTGACLAVAGEGRLSDHEGEILPLETGLAHFSRMSKAPIVPTAVVGTRWVHFRGRIRVDIGEPVWPGDFGPGKEGARDMTDEVGRRLRALLVGVEDSPPPGWFGRWLSEAFNDRPWLTEGGSTGTVDKGDRTVDEADGTVDEADGSTDEGDGTVDEADRMVDEGGPTFGEGNRA